MTSTRASTRRAVPAAFLLFAAALLVVHPAEASRTTTDARSLLAPSSHELAPLELLPSTSADPAESLPRFGFAEDLSLLDVESRPCGFELFGSVGTSRCALTYARNNPLKYVDRDGREASHFEKIFNATRDFVKGLFGPTSRTVTTASSERAQTLKAAGFGGDDVSRMSDRGTRINSALSDVGGHIAGGAAVAATAVGEGLAAELGGRVIALGFAETVGAFSSRFGAETLMNAKNWQGAFTQSLTGGKDKFVFDLTGVNVEAGVARVELGASHGAVDWELATIKNHREAWDRVRFFREGVEVTNPWK